MISGLLFSLLLSSSPMEGAFWPQVADPVTPAEQDDPDRATVLTDIEVNGRPLREATVDFVSRVAATPRGRGAATWHGTFCLGVGNAQRAVADALIDRISVVAESLDLQLGRPGCQPRAFIVYADDADAAARDLVEARGNRFRVGISGADRGDRALAAFVASDRPVRWWHSSAPINPDTGRVVARVPGAPPPSYGQISSPADLEDRGLNTFGSRLSNPLRDDLSQVIIIVDVDQVDGVDFGQLADYLALIALAQIDPDAEAGSYDSILSLFNDPQRAPSGLTSWDQAFLEGLYGAQQTADNQQSRLSAVADNMARKIRQQQTAEAD